MLLELPESCFQTDAQNLTSVWENSCESQIESYLIIIGVVGGVIVAFELVSLIVSCIIKRKFK